MLVLMLGLGGLFAAKLCALDQAEDTPEMEPDPLALFGTIPIYWGESAGVDDLLNGNSEPHWARAELEKRFDLVPIDTPDSTGLAPYRLALMAQPRALSAEENVDLDNWVRGGGKLLLFADPMLTGHSHFGIGDRRRPQDVTLLSPILARWGLEMNFDPDDENEPRIVPGIGGGTPTHFAGRFELNPETRGPGTDCQLISENLIARCAIGRGSALIVADAAVFDSGQFAAALSELTGDAFGTE